jgi:transcriptional regulator with XRE-family HTH domain
MPDILSNDNMKIDTQVLRRLREERSWTQEHLAAVSGVSLRTIQRIEREGNSSAESRLSLAAAFGVDVSILAGQSENTLGVPTQPVDVVPFESEKPSQGSLDSFRRHLAIYLLVGTFLVYRDWSINHTLLWAYWPLMGWGIGVALHGWKTWNRRRGMRAEETGSATKSFVERYGVFLIMSVVFVGLDVSSSGKLTWAFYPILGWGAGLLLARFGSKRQTRS